MRNICFDEYCAAIVPLWQELIDRMFKIIIYYRFIYIAMIMFLNMLFEFIILFRLAL